LFRNSEEGQGSQKAVVPVMMMMMMISLSGESQHAVSRIWEMKWQYDGRWMGK
jgi:hypothetical protein